MGTRRSSCFSLAQGRRARRHDMPCGRLDSHVAGQQQKTSAIALSEHRKSCSQQARRLCLPFPRRCSLATCRQPGLPPPISSSAPSAPAECCATSLLASPRWVGSSWAGSGWPRLPHRVPAHLPAQGASRGGQWRMQWPIFPPLSCMLAKRSPPLPYPALHPQVQCIAALNTFCLFLSWLVPTYFALRHHHEAAKKSGTSRGSSSPGQLVALPSLLAQRGRFWHRPAGASARAAAMAAGQGQQGHLRAAAARGCPPWMPQWRGFWIICSCTTPCCPSCPWLHGGFWPPFVGSAEACSPWRLPAEAGTRLGSSTELLMPSFSACSC